MYFGSIHSEIGSKYKKEKERKIAEKCLQLGEEWTRIVSGDLSDFTRFRVPAGADPEEWKKELRSECKAYIKDNLKKEEVKGAAPTWIFPFILQMFISAIISWIVRKLIDNLFENNND